MTATRASRIGWKRRLLRLASRGVRPIQSAVQTRLGLLCDRWVLLEPVTPDAGKVVVVRLDLIGDFVLWSDAARAIADYYKKQGKHVTLLANIVWSDWAAKLRMFDEVIGMDRHKFREDIRYRLSFGRRIRRLRFGTAVAPTYTRILNLGDSIIRVTGATEKITGAGSSDRDVLRRQAVSNPWFTRLLFVDLTTEQELLRSAQFVRDLTGTNYKAVVPDLSAYISQTLPEELSKELNGRHYFILFPGASYAGRQWPWKRFVELAERLSELTGWIGVVCGGPTEARDALAMCALAKCPLLDWTGRTSLADLASVIAKARLLIGNETSAIHIAASVGVPSVCILGGGHFGRFVPYLTEATDRPLPVAAFHKMDCFNCNWKCIYHPPQGAPTPCVEGVEVDAAWGAITKALPPQYGLPYSRERPAN